MKTATSHQIAKEILNVLKRHSLTRDDISEIFNTITVTLDKQAILNIPGEINHAKPCGSYAAAKAEGLI